MPSSPDDGAYNPEALARSASASAKSFVTSFSVAPDSRRGRGKNQWTSGCASARANLHDWHRPHAAPRASGVAQTRDWASHSADAFGLGCVAYEEPKSNRPMPKRDISWVV